MFAASLTPAVAHQITHADLTAFGLAIETGRRAAHPRPADVDEAERTRRTWACAKATGKGDVRTHDPERFVESALAEVEDWVTDPSAHEIRCWTRPAHDGLLVRIEGGTVTSDDDAPVDGRTSMSEG